MKKAMFRNEANKLTIIENVFVIIMLSFIISFSIPSLNTAIRELFSSTFHSSSGDYSNDSKGILGWIPPQLFLNDNKAVYCYQNIVLSDGAKIIGNTASNLGNEFRFPLPVFPRFPYGTIPPKGNIGPEDASRL
jgi:hypothetical protein